jgi:dienelactone hydrolase
MKNIYWLLFTTVSIVSACANGIPVMEKVSFYTVDSIPLRGTLYLPHGDVDKIAIVLQDVKLDLRHPDYSLKIDTIANFPKIIKTMTENHTGALLFTRRYPIERYPIEAESEKYRRHTTLLTLAEDAEYAFRYLKSRKEFEKTKIGILGSSETGCSAAIAAARNTEISFLMLLSIPGVSGVKCHDFWYAEGNKALNVGKYTRLLGFFTTIISDAVFTYKNIQYQYDKSLLSQCVWDTFMEINHSIIPKYEDNDTIMHYAQELFKQQWEGTHFVPTKRWRPGVELQPSQCMDTIVCHWYIYRSIEFLKWEPERYLPKIGCPVLVCYGEKDVSINVHESIENVKNIAEKHSKKNFTLKTYPDLDHSLIKKDLAVTFVDTDGKKRTVPVAPEYVSSDIIAWMNSLK